ncbi:uncharacterized protein LOC136037960 isoform X1 [Artemia franciscana]|uniref:uncharacterized protein LOC136037960 isoform X1 n=1 Tax=Artemia franciscana TaxID=6661 RepID=UPI0032DA4555
MDYQRKADSILAVQELKKKLQLLESKKHAFNYESTLRQEAIDVDIEAGKSRIWDLTEKLKQYEKRDCNSDFLVTLSGLKFDVAKLKNKPSAFIVEFVKEQNIDIISKANQITAKCQEASTMTEKYHKEDVFFRKKLEELKKKAPSNVLGIEAAGITEDMRAKIREATHVQRHYAQLIDKLTNEILEYERSGIILQEQKKIVGVEYRKAKKLYQEAVESRNFSRHQLKTTVQRYDKKLNELDIQDAEEHLWKQDAGETVHETLRDIEGQIKYAHEQSDSDPDLQSFNLTDSSRKISAYVELRFLTGAQTPSDVLGKIEELSLQNSSLISARRNATSALNSLKIKGITQNENYKIDSSTRVERKIYTSQQSKNITERSDLEDNDNLKNLRKAILKVSVFVKH